MLVPVSHRRLACAPHPSCLGTGSLPVWTGAREGWRAAHAAQWCRVRARALSGACARRAPRLPTHRANVARPSPRTHRASRRPNFSRRARAHAPRISATACWEQRWCPPVPGGDRASRCSCHRRSMRRRPAPDVASRATHRWWVKPNQASSTEGRDEWAASRFSLLTGARRCSSQTPPTQSPPRVDRSHHRPVSISPKCRYEAPISRIGAAA